MRGQENSQQGDTMNDTSFDRNKTCGIQGITLEHWLLEGDGTKDNRGLNQEQQAAVTSSVNTVAAAGAGAGKTFVLARRYAYLVCIKKLKVSEILTLTFTRKATAEMYSRIYQTLLAVANLFGTAEAIQAVADFHSARIQTLDSYCSSIIRQSVGQYGIKPDFVIDDQQAQSMATQLALPFVLGHRHNPAIQMIATTTLSRLDNLADELFAQTVINHSSIANPVNFSQEVENQLQYAGQEFLRLAEEIDRLVYQLQQMIEDEGKGKSTFIPKLQAAVDAFQQEEWETSSLKLDEGETALRFCKAVEQFVDLRLNGQHTKPWNQPLKALKEETYPLLTSLTNLLYRQQELRELAGLLNEFQEQYNRSKRQAGILTFADAAQLALDTLKNQREIRQTEKESYRAIMIDEFQDDNKLQKDLLYALSERLDTFNQDAVPPECLDPGKLFFVGDEKQSIYRFRGADVSVFRGLARELLRQDESGLARELLGQDESGLARELLGQDERGAALSLSYNYRSHPTLIAAFNTIFGGLPYQPGGRSHDYPEAVFMADRETTPDYEATYQEVLAGKITENESPEDKSRRRVHLCLFKSTEAEDNEEVLQGESLSSNHCEAYFVAGKIKELVAAGRNPSDITILFRTTTKQHLFETALRDLGIPYSAETTVNFFQDAPINDILSFLTLFLYPANQTAYSTLLRSPFVGLSKEGLEILLAAQTTHKGSSLAAQTDTRDSSLVAPIDPKGSSLTTGTHTIFNQEDSLLLSNQQEAAAFVRGCQVYHQLAAKARTMPITELVSYLWYQLGYQYKTQEQEAALQYAPLYDKLFHLAAQADAKGDSLAAFVQALQQQVDNQGKIDDISIPQERDNGVQLMTIHKSKGLEFPVVFLVNSNGRPKANQNDAAVYHHQQWGIAVNLPKLRQLGPKAQANFFYLTAQKDEKARELAELRRILYVALTRAEEEVYITGSANPDKETGLFKPSDNPNTMLKLLFPMMNRMIVMDDSSSQEVSVADDSPFDLQWIPPVTRQEIQSIKGSTKNTTALELARSLADWYQGEPVLPAVEESPYRSPSHLAPHSPEYQQEQAQNGQDLQEQEPKAEGGAYSEIDQLVRSSHQKNGPTSFTYTDFGTCAHLYLEAALKDQQPTIPTQYLQHLSLGQQQKLHQLCSTMTQGFLASPTGQAAKVSSWRRAEYQFRYRLEDHILKGSMDLIYQREDGCYQIVDYKTDQKEQPEQYFIQQAAYRTAAAAICGVPEEKVHCALYYLRTGHLVDITAACSQVNHEQLVELAGKSEG